MQYSPSSWPGEGEPVVLSAFSVDGHPHPDDPLPALGSHHAAADHRYPSAK